MFITELALLGRKKPISMLPHLLRLQHYKVVSKAECLLQVTLWYGSIYLVFMFIYYGASSEWVYWVLNWDRPSALGLYALLPLLLFAAHVIWYVFWHLHVFDSHTCNLLIAYSICLMRRESFSGLLKESVCRGFIIRAARWQSQRTEAQSTALKLPVLRGGCAH